MDRHRMDRTAVKTDETVRRDIKKPPLGGAVYWYETAQMRPHLARTETFIVAGAPVTEKKE